MYVNKIFSVEEYEASSISNQRVYNEIEVY